MDLALASELQDFVGSKSEMHSHLTLFFATIHPWLSFMDTGGVYEQVLRSLSPNQTENALLLAAMKPLNTNPSRADMRSTIYRRMKLMISTIEVTGQLTLRILQSLILIALYELGHAIYPAAYLTIGQCARYGMALGINRAIEPNKPATSSEEERRTWWSVIILDR
jgi:hypothetical protein